MSHFGSQQRVLTPNGTHLVEHKPTSSAAQHRSPVKPTARSTSSSATSSPRLKENSHRHSIAAPTKLNISTTMMNTVTHNIATANVIVQPQIYRHPNSPTPSYISSQLSVSTSPTKGLEAKSSHSSASSSSGGALSPLPSPGLYTRSPVLGSTPGFENPNRYHRPAGAGHSTEPTMTQLLHEQPTGMAHYPSRAYDRDSTMSSATGVVSWRKGQGFKEWEKARLQSTEVKRKADVAQLFFYDHYFDLLTYLHARKQRLAAFRDSVAQRQLSPAQEQAEWTSYSGRERVLLRKRRTKLKLDQFHIVTQVGQGGYGEVYLARHKETNQVVALKKMRKKTLLKMDEIRHVLTERDILASTNSPWLVRLLYAFQDPTFVYLAMDFIAGGDFRTLLNNSGVLKEEHARFYIAEMFCAVDQLHRLGYIHRDLKPENFLIDPSGHIKLTDFGLAAGALNPGKIENMKHKLDEVKDTELIYRTTFEMKSIYKSIRMAEPRYADSVVGSPDYMAIETLRGHSYSFSVDYWSLGCILFEFLAGFPPFSGATAEETWANLKNWSRCLRRPHYDRPEDRIFNLSDVGWSAITALIAHKDRRLSTLDEVQRHPFFHGLEWVRLRDKKAPFVPALDSEVDAGYFDDFSNEADMAKYADVREKQRNVDRMREKEEKFGRGVFVGFTFKAKRDEVVDLVTHAHIDDDDETLQTLF
ncbi:AGC/NDR protein kinase [Microbotryum lychnidis-dioicae p1A1 Lamole]|uniref:non-specific serine/threonine protein kinase n=1 Tax=Microbotryum lychnidis-dioicae (strain p1A1 Lamole / MvSl-1064) TaxID=683840 RepID=U5GYZ2_USTV1|nr:AGC/NDR protein kinase [Microbotryum lychnidis-dioicae p1A1 Lamole]|eukprot:KDE09501.1 AGC/NDR protein kinase [Microbotryum lychnidis-dioicae p1A1 Lamole]